MQVCEEKMGLTYCSFLATNLLTSISLLLLLSLFSYHQRFLNHLCAMPPIENMLFSLFISPFRLIIVTLEFLVNAWIIGQSSLQFSYFVFIPRRDYGNFYLQKKYFLLPISFSSNRQRYASHTMYNCITVPKSTR